MSVTAEQWLPVEEVKPAALLAWLERKAAEGWVQGGAIAYVWQSASLVSAPVVWLERKARRGGSVRGVVRLQVVGLRLVVHIGKVGGTGRRGLELTCRRMGSRGPGEWQGRGSPNSYSAP